MSYNFIRIISNNLLFPSNLIQSDIGLLLVDIAISSTWAYYMVCLNSIWMWNWSGLCGVPPEHDPVYFSLKLIMRIK